MSVLTLASGLKATWKRRTDAAQARVPWPPGTVPNSVVTKILSGLALAALVYLAWVALSWGVLNSVTAADAKACRALDHRGACWGLITEKHRLILFGRYPYEEQWRPLLATLVLGTAVVGCCWPRLWGWKLVPLALGALGVFLGLMHGGLFGLTRVPTTQWGGIPLTLMLTVGGLVLAYPLGVLLALGRRSQLPLVKLLCVGYIECIRGVPLITLLFAAAFILPLVLPPGLEIDLVMRVLLVIAIFASAYLAEVVRGGLQAIAKGQYEAATALGLSHWKAMGFVVLPQALRLVVPPTVNTFIGILKDTSLVTIISLYDLTGGLKLALADAQWRIFFIEGYVFISAIYLAAGLTLSRYSQWLERQGSGRQR
jgi:general L-amino acid transport system permease protein